VEVVGTVGIGDGGNQLAGAVEGSGVSFEAAA
jgi:hypothetical protein